MSTKANDVYGADWTLITSDDDELYNNLLVVLELLDVRYFNVFIVKFDCLK
jgi:hypothetical protein